MGILGKNHYNKTMEYTKPEALHPKPAGHKKTTALRIVLFVLAVGVFWYIYTYSDLISKRTADDDSQLSERKAQEQLLVAPESAGMSAEQYAAEVERYATEADTITLAAGCAMEPLILKMNEKKTLKLDNRDTSEHMIVFEDQNFFTVAPNTVREINITEAFGKGQGIYRYRCGEQEKAVGILYVVK